MGVIIFPVFYLGDFIDHIRLHLFGGAYAYTIQNQWGFVIFNILIFIAFMIPLSYRRKANWAERGLVIGFFTSLFIEMYGIPLTIYLAYSILHPQKQAIKIVESTSLFGIHLDMTIGMAYGLFLMILGAALIILGWITLYQNRKKDFVKSGLYSLSRHPQYLGFILVIYGWWVGWPTILTTVTAPILIYKYLKVCSTEESDMLQVKGYREYLSKTRMFF